MRNNAAPRTHACTLLALLLWSGASSAASLQLLSSVDGAPPTPSWKYVRRGQKVLLHARAPGGHASGLRWFKLAPTAAYLDNTTPRFHFEAVPYEELELSACRGKTECPADVGNPHLPAPRGLEGTGTMAFRVEARLRDGRTLSSPGLEPRVSGGIGPLAHRITVRADDSYLGHLTELFGTPYIFGSAGAGSRNQTDLLIGSDCADLAVYGRRRLGRRLEYTSSYGIDQVAPELVKATASDSRGVLSAGSAPLKVGAGRGEARPGDLLHFPGSRHVAVFYEDRPPLGVLDLGDLILHTCWAPPTVEPISATRCSSLPVRVLRFKEGA